MILKKNLNMSEGKKIIHDCSNSAETLWKNNKDEDNSPKTINDKNYQASSQKFTHLKKQYLKPFNWVQTNY